MLTDVRNAALRAADEDGGVLVMIAVWLPVLVLFAAFVVDVGNWFVHKRHLQMQADAGALAGGSAFTIPCSNAAIDSVTRKYAGDPDAPTPYNLQIGGIDQANVHVLVNSTEFWNDGGTNYSDGGGPCDAGMIDVKVTEADLPLFFKLVPGLNTVPAINARARVQIQQLDYLAGGSLPIAVPDVDPTRAEVRFVDEATGTVIATSPLQATGVQNGLAIWDNAAAPVSVPINAQRIGVRVVLSGNPNSVVCGQPLVDCYDAGSTNGLLSVRGWSSAGSGAQPNPPRARDVQIVAGTCSDAYFTSTTNTCTIGVSAVVDFGVADPTTVGARVTATVDGVTRPLEFDAASGRWRTTGVANFFDVDPGLGPVPVELRWEERMNGGVVNGQTCTNGGNNPCKGSFGVVHRIFSASSDRSGPIQRAQVYEAGIPGANSFQLGTAQNLVVKIGVTPNLKNAQSVNDPVVTLRVVGGSQNQSLDCDPNYSNLFQELAYGCEPAYTPNTGTPCPTTAPTLWSSPQPWNCVAIQTGSATNQVARGLNLRILGDEKPTSCTSPNNWSQFPFIPPGDPRVLNVFITPFGSFSGSGSDVTPVTKLGTFYVTGWTSQGGGFNNPCQGNGDDPVPNNDAGNIVGHFIKYIFNNENGGGSGQACDLTAFGSCIAVLVE